MGIFKKLLKKASTPNQKYDLDTIEGIKAIKIPNYSRINGIQSATKNIEYILQRKATEHKKNGNMDLAIECLKKSNEIMPHSNFTWKAKDYLRLIKYLEKAGRHIEAQEELEKLQKQHPDIFKSSSENISSGNKARVKQLRFNGYDCVKFTEHYPTCAECSKYQGRVFSISGKDKRFPKLPEHILRAGQIHKDCKHVMSPYIIEMQSPQELRNDIKFSNRPFIDSRSDKEKKLYEKQQYEDLMFTTDSKNYKELCRLLPSDAPKSFSGYRRMKNANTANYQKLVIKAKEIGLDIDKYR